MNDLGLFARCFGNNLAAISAKSLIVSTISDNIASGVLVDAGQTR
ncbi:MAG: hypothetical protein WAV95_05220 [Azonexus sp.]